MAASRKNTIGKVCVQKGARNAARVIIRTRRNSRHELGIKKITSERSVNIYVNIYTVDIYRVEY